MELRDGCYVLPWNDTDRGYSRMAEQTLPVIAMCMILQESHHFFMDTLCGGCGGRGWLVVGQTMDWPYGEQVECDLCHGGARRYD